MGKKTTTVTEFDENGQVTKITETSEDFEQWKPDYPWRWPYGKIYVGDFPPYYGTVTYTNKLYS